MAEHRCVMCNASDVVLWTLDSGGKAVATYLCKRDAAPLVAVMDAAGELPPSMQKPLRGSDAEKRPVHTRHRRRVMEPLEWTPPEGDVPVVKKKEAKASVPKGPMEPLFWAPEEDRLPLIPDRQKTSSS